MTDAQVIARFRESEGAILVFTIGGKATVELLQSNPLAGFCLAVNWEFHKPAVPTPHLTGRALARKPQREILGWLAFRPESEAVAKIGRKCMPESLSIDRCLRFRQALVEPDVREMLAHLPKVNAGVMGLVSSNELRPYLTPHLLANVAETQSEVASEDTATLLHDLHEMRSLVHRGEPAPKFCSRRQVLEEHDALVLEVNQRGVSRFCRRTFPPPPIPESREEGVEIMPISSLAALHALSREQHNCVASYVRRILNGSIFIYRVSVHDDVCTLSLAKDRCGSWQVAELKGACNHTARNNTDCAVRHWLAMSRAESISRKLTRVPNQLELFQLPTLFAHRRHVTKVVTG